MKNVTFPKRGPMKEVRLFTSTGGYVTTVITAPFQIMPEAIVWGQRIFIKDKNTDEYREGFCVVAWTKEETEKLLA